MNRQPLTPDHGAPLRLVTPLKYGIKQVKQIGRITYTNTRPRDYKNPRTLRNNMHENREKSDCAVVPVKQPNKGGQSSAEAVEGRAQTKENIVQSHMHPTQSRKRMSQGLGGVRKAARERKQERFTA
jgi:DMSO/TMAO reductase YedYZ molybdopterin-dependent catalytic subunit